MLGTDPEVGGGSQPEEQRGPDTPASAHPLRVLVVDDHRLVRQGLVELFEDASGIAVVGEAGDGLAALEQARQLEPDVVLMDVSMPRLDGVEATRQLREQMPKIRIIGLSMHDDASVAEAMRQAGAERFLTKNGPSAALIKAVRGEGNEWRD